MPPRREPFVGAPVVVAFLARRVDATIERVEDGGRRLVVVTEEGEVIAFALSLATGRFVQAGSPVGGAQLSFADP